MKRSFPRFYLILLFLATTCHELISQDIFRYSEFERIQVWTDRTLYAAGEKVFFSALVFNIQDSLRNDFSRIFYCELITPDGKKIAAGKYPVHDLSGKGCLAIPDETVTGTYFLKCYTRFMRNAPIRNYKFVMLKIINPYKPEVLKGGIAADSVGMTNDLPGKNAGSLSMTILSGKKTYSPRDEIRLNIKAGSEMGSLKGLCLSVIPGSTNNDPALQPVNLQDTAKNGIYLPETRGISLSGQLIEKETRKPVWYARVSLSIIGERDILVTRTDSSGRFFFALPDYKGSMDIFLCSDEMFDVQTEILIDNDYCTRPVNLPSPSFTLDEDELNAAYKIAVNAGVGSVYKKEPLREKIPGEEQKVSFYGKPSSVLVLDKYIDLPTLEDYFTELPVIVKIRKVKGKKQFRFFTENIEMSMFDPIVLVDWVPASDIEKILAMSPREIDRVELVEYPYVKGDIIFGGIISFVSKKNDFAGIDLPKSGTFVNYSFLEECDDEISSAPTTSNIPDPRNTVYWNPAVQVNEEGIAEITFTAPDTPGTYQILLRGMTDNGDKILVEDVISVKK